ncbi:MAG: hypothetical protein IPG00_08555 [Saprospiraceae bacterium]|nr:hypothetical protein [Saprospiraceae bacterium]
MDGSIKWQNYEYRTGIDQRFHGSPHFADFNMDGFTEIYINNIIFNGQTGKKLLDGKLNGTGVGEKFDINYSLCVAAQLDDNPNDLELAAGYTVYKIEINNLKW